MPTLDLLILCPVSTLGGAERVAFQIARGAQIAGKSVQVLFKAPIERPEMLEWYKPYGITTGTTPHLKPLSPRRLVGSMLALSKEVRALGPKVVNLHNPGNTILASDVLALRLAGIERVICSLHHPLDPSCLPRSWKLSTKIASKWADTITVTTPVLRETVSAMGVPDAKMTIVPLGVEPLQRVLTRSEARQELGLDREFFIVGCLGRMVAFKRMDAVIRACASIPAFKQSGFLLLAGGGDEETNWKQLAEQLIPGRYRFLGQLPDPSAFYAALDLFALPSELEGFGLVYPEAGLAGVPSVGSDAGGAPYAIQNGKTGFLLPVNEPERVREMIESGLRDPSQIHEMGQAAKRYAETELAIQTFERRNLDLFFPC